MFFFSRPSKSADKSAPETPAGPRSRTMHGSGCTVQASRPPPPPQALFPVFPGTSSQPPASCDFLDNDTIPTRSPRCLAGRTRHGRLPQRPGFAPAARIPAPGRDARALDAPASARLLSPVCLADGPFEKRKTVGIRRSRAAVFGVIGRPPLGAPGKDKAAAAGRNDPPRKPEDASKTVGIRASRKGPE